MTSNDDLAITVYEMVRRRVRDSPDHPFIHCIDTNRTLTSAEVADILDRIASWFADRGVAANHRVAVIGGNSLEYLLIYLSVLRYGATLCAISPDSVGANLDAILQALRPGLVLGDAACDLEKNRERCTSEWLSYGRWPGKPAAPGEFFGQASACVPDPDLMPVGGSDDLATINYTSGTTGLPKGIVHHYGALIANTVGTATALEMGPADRILEYRSFAWLSARARLMTALYSGATLVIAQKFSQSRFFDWIRDQKLTIAFAVPTVINMLVNRPADISRADIPHLRFVTSSTAPLPVEQQRAFEERYGIEILQFYGISEAGGLTANPPGRRKRGSVGRPCLFQDLRIVDADGRILPPGETGEIETGGAQLCTGYLEYDGSITRLPGNRIRTGDVGYLDEDGYLFITGRISETINRGGAKVSPLEIDNILLAHPDVAEAATVGVPDPIYGEEVASFVVPRAGAAPDPASLIRYCAAALPEFKVPRTVLLVDEIPKTARAKVDRKRLRELWDSRQAMGGAPAHAG
jgi:acyl-CoA synthetase (AMP-forming)/AMP-acid ligase II